MSVLGSQLEIDLDPDGDVTIVPRHVGNTGTGCYKLHDHLIKDTKKSPNIPVSEKVEATYMYAPTPPEPDTPEEEEPPDGEDEGDGDSTQPPGSGSISGDRKHKNGKAGGKSVGSSSTASTSRVKSDSRQGSEGPLPPSNSTPHLLDAPLIPGASQPGDSTPALANILDNKNSSSPKSASIGVSGFFIVTDISIFI